MTRYPGFDEVTATPPPGNPVAWMDPDPSTPDMKMYGEWQEFRFRTDITRYINDHLRVLLNGAELYVGHPSEPPEEACARGMGDDQHWLHNFSAACMVSALGTRNAGGAE